MTEKSESLPGTKARLAARRSAITLEDVAREAGVSQSTVSRTLRDPKLVADSTRTKVFETVRALGYVPDRIAGSLASLDSHLIGVVIPSLSNIVFPEVLQGINSRLKGTGIQPVISVSDYDLEQEEALVRGLLAWKPAAILIAGTDHTEATSRLLRQSGRRVVEMMDIDGPPIDISVGLSHQRAGYETGKYLIRRGYRRFGYAGHDWHHDRRARLRYEGCRQALNEAGLGFQAEEISATASSVALGRRQTELLCASNPVDAIVYSNDDMALGGIFHCLGAGISIPDQLAIFGFNGLDIGRELPLPLSTIRSNRFQIGEAAIEAILDQPDRPETPMVIDTGFDLFEGGTA